MIPRRAKSLICRVEGCGSLVMKSGSRRKETSVPELQILTTGLVFGESPRWHDGRLWFSDMGANEVAAVDLEGTSEVVARVPAMPMGTGWLPDGCLLIVSALDGRLVRRKPDGSLVTHADLTTLGEHPWSDMVVDGRGNAYIGNIGFDFPGGEFAPGIVALVTPDGSAQQVADDVAFPNGMVVTPDSFTLILAESYANRLTAFHIAADGSLSNRRVWADLEDGVPDGICLDVEGAVWYGDVPNKCCASTSRCPTAGRYGRNISSGATGYAAWSARQPAQVPRVGSDDQQPDRRGRAGRGAGVGPTPRRARDPFLEQDGG